jgi:F-type H+-transporting ATPase subunit b
MTMIAMIFDTPEHGSSEPHPSGAPDGHEAGTLAEHGETQAYSPFDMTYAVPHVFWLILSFGLLFLVLWKVILPRLASTIEERNDKIADDLDQAARMKSDAEVADRAYASALADSKAKAHAIAADNRAKLETEIAAETDAAETEFAKQAASAETQIREATDAALAHVSEVAESTTGSILAKLSGAKPSAASVKQAVKLASA